MKMGISWLPGALRPAAFVLVLQGGGSRCARRICCHLLATECERRRREHSSGKKADTIGIKRYLRSCRILSLFALCNKLWGTQTHGVPHSLLHRGKENADRLEAAFISWGSRRG